MTQTTQEGRLPSTATTVALWGIAMGICGLVVLTIWEFANNPHPTTVNVMCTGGCGNPMTYPMLLVALVAVVISVIVAPVIQRVMA